MFDLREIDAKNTYEPNLDDKKESYERTYGEANEFYDAIVLYLNKLGTEINILSPEQIYDSCSAVASDLAKCCEMYLKALYIYENKLNYNSVNDIWNVLKNSSFKIDKNGNPIYFFEQDRTKKYIYVKVDNNGNKETDLNGNNIYVDEDGNIYKEGKQGRKIKMNGHQLDRLIDILSNESKMLLEMRMCTIPMKNTELYNQVSLFDVLKMCNIIFPTRKMYQSDYLYWVDKHKKTFEEARYSGQNLSNVNLEFLFHLATQVKSVAQFKINPTNKQDFDIVVGGDLLIKQGKLDIRKILVKLQKDVTNYLKYDKVREVTYINLKDEEFKSMPNELQNFFSFDLRLLSNELIELVKNYKDVEDKISFINMHYCKSILREVSNSTFYNLVKCCNKNEIDYILKLCYDVNRINYPNKIDDNVDNNEYIKKIVSFFRMYSFSIDDIINYSIFVKNKYNNEINNDMYMVFADFMDAVKYYYVKIDKKLAEESDKKYYKL